MRRFTFFLLTCVLVWAVVVALEKPAYAYVDPGSGLYFLQWMSTAFAGVLFVIRRRLRFGKGPKAKREPTAGGSSEG